jgi:hypothetical protein
MLAGTAPAAANVGHVADSGSLQIRQDLDFQRRWGIVQRVGRVVFVLLFAAAIAGIFGTGPLAHASASAPTFSVDYDRFLRATQSSSLQISPDTRQGGGGEIAIDESYADDIEVADVTPQPDSETARGDRLVLAYQDRLPAQVQIQVFPRTIGVHRATIWVRGRPVSFHQVVYP